MLSWVEHGKSFITLAQVQLVGLGLTALWDSISVYIGPSPREREKEKRSDRWEKNVQTTPTRTYRKRNRPLPYYNPNQLDAPALKVYPAPSHPCWVSLQVKNSLNIYLLNLGRINHKKGEEFWALMSLFITTNYYAATLKEILIDVR